ncbi:hypothetical protein [Parachitinimonas caeni]|uniref:Uncharacterized protein n=1 Tax=Parachitinimonas caeni TaxID=3031301 RepID=A0ABT7E6C8_9NEIS|nr:hypothetical protein [Parachitinimonas caeni]MDK2126477.1 hypothetical protein [Parachitinimonas caeni]
MKMSSPVVQSLRLHTEDALQLFNGRKAKGGEHPLAGVRRVASAVEQLSSMESQGHVLVPWLLGQFRRVTDCLVRECRGYAKGVADMLPADAALPQPRYTIEIRFASQHAAVLVDLLHEFDCCVGWMVHALACEVLSYANKRELLAPLRKKLRSYLEWLCKAERTLKALTSLDLDRVLALHPSADCAAERLFGLPFPDAELQKVEGAQMPLQRRRLLLLTEQTTSARALTNSLDRCFAQNDSGWWQGELLLVSSVFAALPEVGKSARFGWFSTSLAEKAQQHAAMLSGLMRRPDIVAVVSLCPKDSDGDRLVRHLAAESGRLPDLLTWSLDEVNRELVIKTLRSLGPRSLSDSSEREAAVVR